MPEKRLERARDTLPDGYQFGHHDHDYRARWRNEWGAYRAICDLCGHDAGDVDVEGLCVYYGTTLLTAVEPERRRLLRNRRDRLDLTEAQRLRNALESARIEILCNRASLDNK